MHSIIRWEESKSSGSASARAKIYEKDKDVLWVGYLSATRSNLMAWAGNENKARRASRQIHASELGIRIVKVIALVEVVGCQERDRVPSPNKAGLERDVLISFDFHLPELDMSTPAKRKASGGEQEGSKKRRVDTVVGREWLLERVDKLEAIISVRVHSLAALCCLLGWRISVSDL
jgi:hypothetical protein